MPLNKWLNSRYVIWQSGTEVPKGQALLARKKAKSGSFTFLNTGRKPYSCASGPAMIQTGGWCQRSRIAATPIPPAVQIEMSPRPEPRSASCFASPATMRAPVAPNGWPTATLPPFGFILPRLIEPRGCVRLSRVRQYSSDSQAFSVQSTGADVVVGLQAAEGKHEIGVKAAAPRLRRLLVARERELVLLRAADPPFLRHQLAVLAHRKAGAHLGDAGGRGFEIFRTKAEPG